MTFVVISIRQYKLQNFTVSVFYNYFDEKVPLIWSWLGTSHRNHDTKLNTLVWYHVEFINFSSCFDAIFFRASFNRNQHCLRHYFVTVSMRKSLCGWNHVNSWRKWTHLPESFFLRAWNMNFPKLGVNHDSTWNISNCFWPQLTSKMTSKMTS